MITFIQQLNPPSQEGSAGPHRYPDGNNTASRSTASRLTAGRPTVTSAAPSPSATAAVQAAPATATVATQTAQPAGRAGRGYFTVAFPSASPGNAEVVDNVE